MKRLFIILFLSLFSHFTFAQSDTIYVDEVDTVVVQQKPMIVTKTVYHKEKSQRTYNTFSFLVYGGTFWDFSNYEICEECKEEFKKLRSSYSYTSSIQYGLLMRYQYKKVSFGVDLNYRQSSKKIDYSNDSNLVLKSTLKVNYFMLGPTLGYKIINKKTWDLDLLGGVLFSFTIDQSGQIITGEKIDTITDVKSTPYISKENFLYHFSPTITFKASKIVGISIAPHYYFDHNSNVINQSYTEQRNSLGASLGIKFSL
jgi:hypothetical protein